MFGRKNGDDHPRDLDEDRRNAAAKAALAYGKPEQRATSFADNFTVLNENLSNYPQNPPIDLKKMEAEMEEGHRIKAIKGIVRKLTYGEMIEFVQQVTNNIPERHVEKGQNSLDWMPDMFHKWATND